MCTLSVRQNVLPITANCKKLLLSLSLKIIIFKIKNNSYIQTIEIFSHVHFLTAKLVALQAEIKMQKSVGLELDFLVMSLK